MLLYSCPSGKSEEKKQLTDITIIDTYRPEQLLPDMAFIDIISDTANLLRDTRAKHQLTGEQTDSLNINISDYLSEDRKNSLFRIFYPNVRRKARSSSAMYEQSSWIGFSVCSDTAAVNKMLMASGKIRRGTDIKWIPYRATGNTPAFYGLDPGYEYAALSATGPSARITHLSADSVDEVRPEDYRASKFWQLIDRLEGRNKYRIRVTFTSKTTEMVRDVYSEDSVLLLKCRYNNRDLYFSGTVAQMENGASFGEVID